MQLYQDKDGTWTVVVFPNTEHTVTLTGYSTEAQANKDGLHEIRAATSGHYLD